jgi:DNA polymerase-1
MLFDCGKVDFRLKLAPDYKANRPPMPDDLKSQIPLIKRIAAAFGWQQYACEGYEADDLIGAVARHCEKDYRIMVLSSDKDLSQLVNENVSMLVPQNGNKGDFEVRGVAEVTEKFGVPPEMIVDYLALLGDSSDNIAGVPGIGPKSAAELLNSCGAAENWIEAPEKIRESRFFKKLDGNFELLKRNRKLVAVRTEMVEELAGKLPELLTKKSPDWAEIAEICRDNQFVSILKELPEVPEVEAVPEAVEAEMDLFSFVPPTSPAEKTAAPETPQQLELF